MTDIDLFTEIFPLEPAALSHWMAYRLEVDADGDLALIVSDLTQRLQQSFPGIWLWLDEHILTDTPRTAVELMITLDILREDQPEIYMYVETVEEDPHWQPNPQVVTQLMMWTMLPAVEDEMRQILAKPDLRVPHARIAHTYVLRPWFVAGQPCLSLSIIARLLADRDLLAYAAEASSTRALIGLKVADKTSDLVGEILGSAGKVGPQRERLLKQAPSSAMEALIRRAADDEPVFRVQVGAEEVERLASALEIVIRTTEAADDLERFSIDARAARRALRLKPANQAQLVKLVSDIPKNAGFLANAFNSREAPDLFLQPSFEANLMFENKRVRPYNPATLGQDFASGGLHWRRKEFAESPIRIAVINTLSVKVDDFVEAMKRDLERRFHFSIELLRERKVKVLSRKNLDSAVKAIEGENAQIVLVFVPDEDGEMTADDTVAYLKSLVVAKGIASHVIREAITNQPEAMPTILMGVLGKTGNIPFVLAEPLVYAHFIVGIDLIHQTRGEVEHVVALARIYRSNGAFVRYALREIDLTTPNMLFVLLRDVFPQKEFGGKKVFIHHHGPLGQAERDALAKWGQAIDSTFYPVEIMTSGAPHLYALRGGKIVAPPWGSAFRVSDTEAFLISATPTDDTTPLPLHIRTQAPLLIEHALHSVLVWTLLAYGAFNAPRQPVTIQNSEVITQWLAKSGLPEERDGTMPFWL